MKLQCHAKTRKGERCAKRATGIGEWGNALCEVHGRPGPYPECLPAAKDEWILIDYKGGGEMAWVADLHKVSIEHVERLIRDALDF